jgi:20S proteasome alpha/beta subunit
MDSCIALKGKDYVIMAADTSHANQILVQLTDLDKILELDSEKVTLMIVL